MAATNGISTSKRIKDRTALICEIVSLKLELVGEPYTNKKLQKLLYYVQAWGLVFLGKELLNEDFQAWVHGPVLPSLYHDLKNFSYNNLCVEIPKQLTEQQYLDSLIEKAGLSVNEVDLIDEVLEKYCSLSAMELELLSHSEAPWIDARGNIPPHMSCTKVISKESMKSFYSKKVGKA